MNIKSLIIGDIFSGRKHIKVADRSYGTRT